MTAYKAVVGLRGGMSPRARNGGRFWRLCLVAVCGIAPFAIGAKPKARTESPAQAKRPDVPPLESDTLTEHARLLFDAIATGKPELADPFFFPREPFLPLKDVDDPGRYHEELVRTYHRDILRLHAKRRSWEGARFVRFVPGSSPRWIEPGREWNKVGYYRSLDGKLAYEVSGKARTLVVRTIISWDGQWYVTHLSPTKH